MQQDALRRDFTVNALFLRLSDMEVLDLTKKGLPDIKNKIIRVTDSSSADVIFNQDPLRILRAVRQKLQLGFDIEPVTFEAMKKASRRISIAAPERIREEINKILTETAPSGAFKMMDDINLLKEILPEISRLKNLKQPSKYHDDDVFAHTLKVLDRTNTDLVLRMSALLHDTGKFSAFKQEGEKITFYGHENSSVLISGEILKRLHYPKEFSRKVINIVKNHMHPKNYSSAWKDSAVRRFAASCGEETDYVIELAKADFGKDKPDEKVFELINRIDFLRNRNMLCPKEELISGSELMEYFGLTQGEWIKKAKETVREAQMDNPEMTKDAAFALVKEMLNNSGK